jgi:hypothetical protein
VKIVNYPDTAIIGSRELEESISLKSIPILLCTEFSPISSQFNTYIGIGLGCSFTRFSWQETVQSTVNGDKRIGGLLYDNSSVVPALRLYTGIRLGFDSKFTNRENAGSLIIEARYSHIPYSVYPFEVLSQQNSLSQIQNEEVTVGASAVSLMIGLQFNLSEFR